MRSLPLRSVVAALLCADVATVGVHVVHHLLGEPSQTLRFMTDLDGEATVGAWLTSGQLLVAGLATLLAVYWHGGRGRGALTLFGAGLVFLSADEIIAFHESMTRVLGRITDLPRFAGGHGVWIPIYLTLGAVFFVVTARAWSELRATRPTAFRWIAGGIGTFLVGAVALEIVSYGRIRESDVTFWYEVEVVVEESLELWGASMILVGALLLLGIVEYAVTAPGDPTTPSPPSPDEDLTGIG